MVTKITLLEAHFDRTDTEPSPDESEALSDGGKENLPERTHPADRSLGRMLLDIGVLAFFLVVGFVMLRRDESDPAEPIIIEDRSAK